MPFDVRLREIQFKTIDFYLCCLFQKGKKKKKTKGKAGRMKERKREKKKGRRLDNEEVTQKFKM